MRKLFWAFSGLTIPAGLGLRGRGFLAAQQPESPLNDPVLRSTAADGVASRGQVPAIPPRSPFAVKPTSGPWMICAAHYTGPYAAYLADQVVRQLRDRR